MSRAEDRIVVVGAGVGGLAAAMTLAGAGAEVLVLEAAATPGGKMRTMDSAAGPVDAGPTVLTLAHVFEELFGAVGARLDDHVTLVREPMLARHFWADGSRLDLWSDVDANAAAISGLAGPESAADYRAFQASASRLYDAFERPVMQAAAPSRAGIVAAILRDPRLVADLAPWARLEGRLAARFRDPRLAQLFGRYATYVGGMPGEVPALLALVWEAERRGVWRVEGGMHRLAEAMAGAAERAGARFRYGAAVAGIETGGSGVRAVRLASGERIAAGRIVFNGDPRALTTGLLGSDVQGAVPVAAVEPRSLSARVWSFAARVSGPDLAHHNLFFSDRPNSEFAQIARGEAPSDPTLYLCAEDRGAGRAAPDGAERFEIIMNAAPGAETAGDRERCRTQVFQRLRDFGLNFSPLPDGAALTGPATFGALFPGSAGSLYGRSPAGLTAAFARPTARTRVPGLYLAGGGAHPGAGVPMAATSGRHAGAAILRDRASTSRSPRTATRGGMSTGSPTTIPAPSRSSPS